MTTTKTATIAVTGAAAGVGAATAARLVADGHRVITLDRSDAEVTGDLGTEEGRRRVLDRVIAVANGVLDGFVHTSPVGDWRGRRGALVVSAHYFGAVSVLEGLRPALARSGDATVVLSAPSLPSWPAELEHLCLAGAEDQARELADQLGATAAYGAAGAAVARYVRRHAMAPEWIGAGIRLITIAAGVNRMPSLGDDLNDPRAIEALGELHHAAQAIATRITLLLGPETRAFWRSVMLADLGPRATVHADDRPAPSRRRHAA